MVYDLLLGHLLVTLTFFSFFLKTKIFIFIALKFLVILHGCAVSSEHSLVALPKVSNSYIQGDSLELLWFKAYRFSLKNSEYDQDIPQS